VLGFHALPRSVLQAEDQPPPFKTDAVVLDGHEVKQLVGGQLMDGSSGGPDNLAGHVIPLGISIDPELNHGMELGDIRFLFVVHRSSGSGFSCRLTNPCLLSIHTAFLLE
jgi:hypothetical protein